ncbi:MAG: tRNA (adenosine(37)-N6)-threonylcarbamoyltransferase complex ATPase subunit type 1 TsaE [Pseudobdellovibrio sp.]
MKLIQKTVEIKDLIDLKSFAKDLTTMLPRGSCVLLSGPLGAGKTSLVSAFCEHLHVKVVQSPTYAIHHRYRLEKMTIDHFDLYRLETEDEIQASGFYDLLAEPTDYKFVEWSERVGSESFDLMSNLFRIEISMEAADKTRLIRIFQLN